MKPAFYHFLHRLEDGLLVLLMAGLLIVAFAQILLRNLFSVALPWADPLMRHLVLWAGFSGALIAARLDRHIAIDALSRFFSPRQRCLAGFITHLFSAFVCLVLAWTAIQFLSDERASGTRAFFDLPTWQLQLVFPLSFGLLAVRFAHRALGCLKALFGPGS
jgi:TRAP-type C4-dicarboxylate transport system permease small subunit